jgi:hypothetical protein
VSESTSADATVIVTTDDQPSTANRTEIASKTTEITAPETTSLSKENDTTSKLETSAATTIGLKLNLTRDDKPSTTATKTLTSVNVTLKVTAYDETSTANIQGATNALTKTSLVETSFLSESTSTQTKPHMIISTANNIEIPVTATSQPNKTVKVTTNELSTANNIQTTTSPIHTTKNVDLSTANNIETTTISPTNTPVDTKTATDYQLLIKNTTGTPTSTTESTSVETSLISETDTTSMLDTSSTDTTYKSGLKENTSPSKTSMIDTSTTITEWERFTDIDRKSSDSVTNTTKATTMGSTISTSSMGATERKPDDTEAPLQSPLTNTYVAVGASVSVLGLVALFIVVGLTIRFCRNR